MTARAAERIAEGIKEENRYERREAGHCRGSAECDRGQSAIDLPLKGRSAFKGEIHL